MKNSDDTIGSRNRDLPACSAVRQPTALHRAHSEPCGCVKYGELKTTGLLRGTLLYVAGYGRFCVFHTLHGQWSGNRNDRSLTGKERCFVAAWMGRGS